MKEKIGAYKWLLVAICIVACDVAWNVYQNQSLKQGIELKSDNQNPVAYEQNQEVLQFQQGLSESQDEKNIMSQPKSEEAYQEGQCAKVNKVSQEVVCEEVPIYICGAIKNPGVYYVTSNAIVNDVIKLSGGLTEEADEMAINLARPIEPYQKIIVPKMGEEIDKLGDSYENRERVERIEGTSKSEIEEDDKLDTYVKQETGLVNINTATKEQLMTLNGIGAVKAQAVIDYRQENGGFYSIDEMMQISGIGEKTFEKIKQFITT